VAARRHRDGLRAAAQLERPRALHVDADGAQRKFQVSGEPMFSESCRFIGYRGIGVELTAKA
jgi:hypothetical protein